MNKIWPECCKYLCKCWILDMQVVQWDANEKRCWYSERKKTNKECFPNCYSGMWVSDDIVDVRTSLLGILKKLVTFYSVFWKKSHNRDTCFCGICRPPFFLHSHFHFSFVPRVCWEWVRVLLVTVGTQKTTKFCSVLQQRETGGECWSWVNVLWAVLWEYVSIRKVMVVNASEL